MSGLFVFFGGGLGSLLRWAIFQKLGPSSGSFPYATLSVNLLGSFLIGLLYASVLSRVGFSESIRLGLGVGLLGGFTTFSAFSLDGLNLIESKAFGFALIYLFGSLVLGLAFAYFGLMLGRSIN